MCNCKDKVYCRNLGSVVNEGALLLGCRLMTFFENVEKRKIKKGRLITSHRYDHLPLLPSGPGGVQQELVV
jgi:hypothetical protein